MILNIVIVIAIVLVFALFANIVASSKVKKQISFKESMDLIELPVITLVNNGVKLNFLLDTGSNMSHINKSLMPKLQYQSTGESADTIGIEGNKVSNDICEMVIMYKDQQFKEEFNVSDLDEAFSVIKQESGVQIHGILGSLFFQRYKYVLDFDSLVAYLK